MGELITDRWLEVTAGKYQFERPGWPCQIVLAARARQLLAGWPRDGGEALYGRFIATIDAMISEAGDNAEERTKLERF